MQSDIYRCILSRMTPVAPLDLTWIPLTPKKSVVAHDLDFYKLFSLIRNKFSTCYLFESLALPRHQDRFHVIGFDPIAIFTGAGSTLTVQGDNAALSLILGGRCDGRCEVTLDNVDPYKVLSQAFPSHLQSITHEGGLIGYFSHEAVNYFEPSLHLPEHKDFKGFRLGLYLDGLIYDTETNTLSYYTFGEDRGGYVGGLLDDLTDHTIPCELASTTFLGHSATKDDFVRNVDAARRKIIEGYSFQIEVGFKSVFDITGDKLAIYHRLRMVNPSPYMYFLKFGELELMGASPEILVTNHQGVVSTTPTAGTIRRGDNEYEDRQLARTLLNDPKEIAEHNMLVDLHRNDIAKVSAPGSVRVMDSMFLIKFSHVQHIVSLITSVLAPNKTSFDLLASILPAGVTTGAPKIETIQIISSLEKAPRGPYGGAVGRFSFNGDCDFCIPIRSLFCVGDRCFLQTSAGVVYDSIALSEYDEVIRKLSAMMRSINAVSVHA